MKPEPPPEIHAAAQTVTDWFSVNGIEGWEFAGLADRRLVAKDSLAPCPFCGFTQHHKDRDTGLLGIELQHRGGSGAAVCNWCGLTGPTRPDPQGARDAWNRLPRYHTPPEPHAATEAP